MIMFYIYRTKRVILFLFLLTITELSVSQTRTFSFKNKASQEGLMITNQDSSCLQGGLVVQMSPYLMQLIAEVCYCFIETMVI